MFIMAIKVGGYRLT